jgi:hypothetical protein
VKPAIPILPADQAGTSTYGVPTGLSVTITPVAGGGTPTGSVTFQFSTTTNNTVTVYNVCADGSLQPQSPPPAQPCSVPLTSGTAAVANAKLPAGADNIKATYSGDTNYAGGEMTAINMTVSQASTNAGLSITPNSPAPTYGDTLTLTATISDSSAGSTGTPTGMVQFAYSTNNGASWTDIGNLIGLVSGQAQLQTAALPAGNPLVRAHYPGDANFKNSDVSVTQTINQKTLTVTGITAGDKVYDGTTTAPLNTTNAILNGVIGTDVTLDKSAATGAFADKNVGAGKTVTISGLTLIGTASANYILTQPAAAASITTRPITVTADTLTKVYGDADPALTYKLSASLVAGDSLTGALTRSAGNSVGTYAIQQGTLAATANYALTYSGANLTITAKALKITANDKTRVFGAANPSFDATYYGLIPGETSSTAGVLVGTLSCTTTATVNSPVATSPYPITCSGQTAPNYTITYVPGVLAVTQDSTAAVITSHTPVPSVVGQSITVAFSISVDAPGSGTPTGTVAVSDGVVTCQAILPALSCSLTPVSAGTKTLTATYSGDGNFKASAPATASHAVGTRTTGTSVLVSPGGISEGDSAIVTVTVTDTQTLGSLSNPAGIIALSSSVATDTFGPCVLAATAAPGVSSCSAAVSARDDRAPASATGYSGSTPHTISASFVATSVHTASAGMSSATVANVKPVIGAAAMFSGITANPLPAPTTVTAIGVNVPFTDAGVLDTHTCTLDWDDNSTKTSVPVTESGGSGSCAGAFTHTYSGAGVYTLKVTVTDDDGGAATFTSTQFIVVYDPNAGFVTGGGWIMSPAGAYSTDPTLSGKANFGFVSKYQKGANAPTGETEFNFAIANFDFHSTVYQWLVVSGPLAQYKGTGTINGAGSYNFLLTATDGDAPGGGGVDKFRIKVTDSSGAVIYDNSPGSSDDINGANPLAIGGGSIVIHSK